ncbi:RE1-silencing transcription factor isoform X2 [Platichthys flesus]|uniref:RE1-silencing transcription factor isoform X2 n=1 Tax=Platichthys flesus TaxID=8260 RepID=UPI002DBFA41E|nr:RE1-silencing transcription factor isoform X2 [Platichthys flesus]
MAAHTVFSEEMFPVEVSVMEEGQSLNTLPAPQLVMLANVAAVTAGEGVGCDGSTADEKEMMELKTVGSSYSDSEDENIISYSYDNQNHREVCIIEYPESPAPPNAVVGGGSHAGDEEEDDGEKAEDLSHRPQPCPPTEKKTPQKVSRLKDGTVPVTEGAKKKKPFHCKPCHFQAQNEQQFVEHLGTHSVSKMMVVNRVEGRSKTKAKETENPDSRPPSGGEGDSSGETGATSGDIKGLIRCERCGYNTNRYDHYIAHLKHHSKEGEDHRVFKCTLCPYTTVSQYHWRKHLRNHFPSKLHTCSQCSYFSDRKSNYIQHIRTHTGVRPFQCLYCDYSSSQKTHLTRHMRTHSGERPFKCESCNYLAANQHEVTRHARQVHNGPKPLSCPYCDYKTADRSNFKKHVELHLNPRQFLCPLCKYAASKKCNLQYHIKSRHSGCDVSVDVSKVKLRAKKLGPDSAEPNSDPRTSKFDNSSCIEEDSDMDDGNEAETLDSSPINLSIRKSSRPSTAHSVQSETAEKNQKKSNVTSEKEKLLKTKDKMEPERKITTRQKKNEKVNEKQTDNTTAKETQAMASLNTDSKVKRRVKKLPAEKPTVQDQAEAKSLKDQKETEKTDQQRSKEERVVWTKVVKDEEKAGREKEQKNDGSGKENKSFSKHRKLGSKKTTEPEEEAQQKPQSPQRKEKTSKRKVGEVLDLSKKCSAETPSKTRRMKAVAAEKLQSEPASDESTKADEATPTQHKSNGATPVKHKMTRKSSKRVPGLQQPSASSASTEAPEASTQPENPTGATNSEPPPTEPIPEKQETPTDETVLEKPLNLEASDTCSPDEDTPSPAEPRPAPTFLKPTSPPSLVLPSQRIRPADTEDDEGIHSSHEGGSDISDSASEGSDDSGLNGTGPRSGKMANDPETPTDEIPTPTELKSHLCIFCDRTFPLEGEYRRHLNRHLVNVYYMDEPAKGQN